ncbi:Hypothetical predicted protein [Paramuricea clavata]|uniref:Integrator complex subunit 1 INTS2-binding domain-containing protein n=1 Tax=Paramuricea clavata TaxID=317549 RepID=A0A6S7LRV7_PARCT|nr:Hypothetical predicted protein [Paramuricea clavata]
MPTLPYFDAVLGSLTFALRKACSEELNFERLQTYIIFLSKYSTAEFAKDVSVDLAQLVLERSTVLKNILQNDTAKGRQTHQALLKAFTSVVARALETSSSELAWDDVQESLYVRWSKNTTHAGKATTMGIYIIHATMVLLTFGPPHEGSKFFDQLLDTWCPGEGNVKAFLPNTGEEVVLIPDWLRLKMICSNVQRLEDIAFSNIEPAELIAFAQSFGIPVRSTRY